VLILGNHGLVVAAEDCDSAESLLDDVERRLALPPRTTPAANPINNLELIIKDLRLKNAICYIYPNYCAKT